MLSRIAHTATGVRSAELADFPLDDVAEKPIVLLRIFRMLQ